MMAMLAALADDGSELAAQLMAVVAQLAAAEGHAPSAAGAPVPEAAGPVRAGVAAEAGLAPAATEPAAEARQQAELPTQATAEAPAVQPPPPPPTAEQLAVRRSRALAMRRCANALCPNLGGVSEARLKGQLCSGCQAVRFCSVECSRVAWHSEHRLACAALRREATVAAAAGTDEGDG